MVQKCGIQVKSSTLSLSIPGERTVSMVLVHTVKYDQEITKRARDPALLHDNKINDFELYM